MTFIVPHMLVILFLTLAVSVQTCAEMPPWMAEKQKALHGERPPITSHAQTQPQEGLVSK